VEEQQGERLRYSHVGETRLFVGHDAALVVKLTAEAGEGLV
jgi:hypothetical protein